MLLETLFDNINVSCLLEWAHVGMEEKIAVFLANKKKIPSIYLQHGMHALNSNYEKYIDYSISSFKRNERSRMGKYNERFHFISQYQIR